MFQLLGDLLAAVDPRTWPVMQPASSDCEAQDRAGRWARCYPRSRTRGSTPPWAAPPRVHLGADSGDRHPASLRRYSYRPNCVSVRP